MGTSEISGEQGTKSLVHVCAALKHGEKVAVITNSETEDIAALIMAEARSLGCEVLHQIMPSAGVHGEEPPKQVADAMFSADVIFCLTLRSLAHTTARKMATDRGARYLSLPDYSMLVLRGDALTCDFRAMVPKTDHLGELIDNTKSVRVETAKGTELRFETGGRTSNRCPGVVDQPGMLGSPPDVEVNIAPLEGTAQGVLVIDGSIPCREVGLLQQEVRLTVVNGAIDHIEGPHSVVHALETLFAKHGAKARALGEFGIGLNPKASLCGVMLEDEGCAGTVHFGFGSNATIGGVNDVGFHLDFVMRSPTVWFDSKKAISSGLLLHDEPGG